MENSEQSPVLLSNRYQLLQTLGSGGMAVVYRARDTLLERPVAIKILREDYSSNQNFREQFRQEAMAAANLSHPNIVTVHDFGFDNDHFFLVMEFIPGTNLKAILKHRGKLPVDESLHLITQACAGIGYAHRAGLVHCDIKPHNMIVTPDQRLKVTDFGIARALITIQPDEQHEIIWGSPSYLSPEQAAGLAPSPSSDVYSLGVVLYELLTGQTPFISEDPVELIRLHRDTPPMSPRKLNPDIPIPLEHIILKILSKEPSARYRSADQLGRVLDSYLTQYPSQEKTNSKVVDSHIKGKPAASNPIPSRPNTQTASIPPLSTSQEVEPMPAKTDWGTIFLSLVTILMVGGLIPFWLFIWFTLSAR